MKNIEKNENIIFADHIEKEIKSLFKGNVVPVQYSGIPNMIRSVFYKDYASTLIKSLRYFADAKDVTEREKMFRLNICLYETSALAVILSKIVSVMLKKK